MEENTVAKKGKLGKIVSIVFVLLLVAYFIATQSWRMSGTNQWELKREGNGAQVYTLKAPGVYLVQAKGKIKVNTSLSAVVSFLQDTEACPNFGCLDAKIIDRKGENFFYWAFKYPMPFGLPAREFVTSNIYYQDPESKTIFYNHTAVPEKLPADDCCVRVTNYSVHWKITPLSNNEVEIDMTRNLDLGGYLPDLMVNLGVVDRTYNLLFNFKEHMEKDIYKNAQYDFIQELEAETIVADN
ncbi:MAG: hypothetical protein OQJ89_08770 [Kangiellaceae bacterium]|nr:hypothetical protein [Kangiellaceae bacterium]MCW9000538.1 hypothetical protein [Kangiellaceae bacterium]MCW9017042.1 hypothetical protein [Kangiellaceae bacterium]